MDGGIAQFRSCESVADFIFDVIAGNYISYNNDIDNRDIAGIATSFLVHQLFVFACLGNLYYHICLPTGRQRCFMA
jgi:hypothetical protein